MRWTPRGRSQNLEDRRGTGGSRRAAVPMGIGGTLLLIVLSLIFGQDFLNLTDTQSTPTGSPPGAVTEAERARQQQEEPMVQFVSFVLDDAQRTWQRVFSSSGRTYQDARLVLFRDDVQSACGVAGAATGPFYCPADQKVYIDLSFYDELARRFGAPGDFAQAYVLAHEVGHHVQTLLGLSGKVRQLQERNPEAANQLSVGVELQADCFAGVWGHSTAQRDLLERGDIEEGLQAAAAIGDDRLQRSARGYVTPDSFTHGSSAQRVQWFRRGLESGRIEACDTFAAR